MHISSITCDDDRAALMPYLLLLVSSFTINPIYHHADRVLRSPDNEMYQCVWASTQLHNQGATYRRAAATKHISYVNIRHRSCISDDDVVEGLGNQASPALGGIRNVFASLKLSTIMHAHNVASCSRYTHQLFPSNSPKLSLSIRIVCLWRLLLLANRGC